MFFTGLNITDLFFQSVPGLAIGSEYIPCFFGVRTLSAYPYFCGYAPWVCTHKNMGTYPKTHPQPFLFFFVDRRSCRSASWGWISS